MANFSYERIEIPASPNPVGSGARALGMGGAFISIADDATAASWNPGGLIQLEKPELSMVYAYTGRQDKLHFENHPEASENFRIDYSSLNYLSAAYPFRFKNMNMIVSLTHQHLYNFQQDFSYFMEIEDAAGLINRTYFQDGGLYATGISYAIQISPALSAGLTLNFWGDTLMDSGWNQKDITTSNNELIPGFPIQHTIVMEENFAFEGMNLNLGFLWNFTSSWTVGGVLKAPFIADIDHVCSVRSETDYNNPAMPNDILQETESFKEKLEMPMSYGLGIAYRHSDKLTFSVECYRTHWEDFIYENYKGEKNSPVSRKPVSLSSIDTTTWFRMGVEYLFIGDTLIIPLRGGIFYDPAPAEDSPDDFYGFSLGSGIVYRRVAFDIAYQYRWGDDVGSDLLSSYEFSQDVDEHTLYTSIVFHF